MHFKSVVVDGVFAYMGSANLPGAGMGAKSIGKRNFESGITTNDAGLIRHIMDQFDFVWIGKGCETCKRVQFCPDHKIMDELGHTIALLIAIVYLTFYSSSELRVLAKIKYPYFCMSP